MAGYTDNERNVILAEAAKLDFDDIMAFGPHYFGCGWMKDKYYNLNYAVALSLIGRLYGDKESKNSDYHKGVVYISDATGVSKRQVKILRKKVKKIQPSFSGLYLSFLLSCNALALCLLCFRQHHLVGRAEQRIR